MNGPSAIPLSEIREYCSVHGITRTEEVCQVIDYIQAMDQAYIKTIEERKEAEGD